MRAVPRAADKRALLRSKVGAHSRRRHLRYRALSRVPAVWEVPGAPAEFQVGADSHANFPCSFFGGGGLETRARAAELPNRTLPPSVCPIQRGRALLSRQSHCLPDLVLWLGRRHHLERRAPSPISSAL